MNILVVDDEPAYRQLLESFLKMDGSVIYKAANGQEALKLISETNIDVIISDIYMPIMDGLKFHTATRAIPRYAITPFIFVSGYSDANTLNAIPRTKHDGFLQKTQSLSLLKDWIQYLLTPEEKRASVPPFEKPKVQQYERMRDGSYHKRR